MRSKLAIVVAALGAAIALLATTDLVPAANYDELLAQAKRDSTSVDFQTLRYAYADSDSYDPYNAKEGELRVAMVKAFAEKDCGAAIKNAQAILERNYLYIEAHMIADLCYRRSNELQQAKHHEQMARGLFASITASGNGKTPKTAYVVISVPEEYSVLSMSGLKRTRQALLRLEGHRYDRLTVLNKSGGIEDVFFNIDRLYAWGMRKKNP